MKQIVVIGSGTMGNGIAHVFAQSGFQVNMVDISAASLEKAMQTIATNLDRQIKKGTLTEEEKAATLGKISTHTALENAVAQADLVVEAATENLEIKLDLLKLMIGKEVVAIFMRQGNYDEPEISKADTTKRAKGK